KAESQQVAEDGNEAGSKEVIEDVDICGEAGNEPADRMTVEEADMHALHVDHEFPAEVEHGELADRLHDVHLAELCEEDSGQDGEIDGGDLGDAGEGVGREISVEQAGSVRWFEVTVDGD